MYSQGSCQGQTNLLHVWLFTTRFDVPPTNNGSESAIRGFSRNGPSSPRQLLCGRIVGSSPARREAAASSSPTASGRSDAS